jgi:hypothetical protein
MAVSESDVDRELLNRIAEAYFARRRKQSAASPDEGRTDPNKTDRPTDSDPGRQKATPQYRRHWRDALRFTPLMIL